MGFFTRTAMDMLMKTTHPEINRRQCWNLHPHRKPCTECKDICPYGEQIFTRPNLVKDWDPCTECGLCVSACRSGCIIPSPEQVQRDTSAADTDNDTIWIGCEKSTRKNSMVRTCISALTWETLAYLALNKKIVLDLTPCGECENDLCAAQLRKELTRLVDFFGQPMFEARFTLAYEPDEALYHVKELSRREMFEQVSHGSKSGTKKLLQMLPGLHSEDDGGVDFRLLLHQRTKQLKASMETPLKYGYYLPNFTDKCFGCGKCEKACRAGALKLEDLPDGATVAVPNDATNEGRALLLLEAQGLIKLKEGITFTATVLDIAENPKNLSIKEIEAAQLARSLQDVDAAVINGNYAIQAGLKVKDALAIEDKDSIAADTYANVLVVKEGHENDEATKALLAALQSDTAKKFMEEKYEGAVIAAF